MKRRKHEPEYRIIMLFMSLFLLSVSLVSSVGVWKNRSFYFKDYIYSNHLSSALRDYCADVHRLASKTMKKEEAELFEAQNAGVYYYVTDGNTGEAHTNIPANESFTDYSSRENILSFRYVNAANPLSSISESVKVIKAPEQPGAEEVSFSGYVLIDRNAVLSGPFHQAIEEGLKLRQILFLESGVLAAALLPGIALFFMSFKKAAGQIAGKTDFIPIDVKLGSAMAALALWFFLYGTYSYTIRVFSALTRRMILYGIFIVLTFSILSLSVILILKMRRYAADKFSFYQEWENRLTKNVPLWCIGLVLQLGWYFFVLAAVSPDSTIYGYMTVIKSRWAVILAHNAFIALIFIVIRQLRKSKAAYAGEVLSAAREIAGGDLSRSAPVLGNNFYAQIADHLNTIKADYIRALAERKKSERLKYELVTNISHDLRTPLTSILNYLGLVKKEGVEGDIERYIDHAGMNAERLNILIEDLFELSKLESGNMELDISNVNLVLMLKQIGHEYEEKMKQNGLELIFQSTGRRILLRCDSLKIWRVFDNLINNAVKYSLPGTRIYVAAEEQSGELVISVKNIAARRIDFEAEELFLRFKRGDGARNSEGSGLGLAIAKSIVELHKGTISIETEGDMFKVLIRFSAG